MSDADVLHTTNARPVLIAESAPAPEWHTPLIVAAWLNCVRMSPATPSARPGLVVPMPTFTPKLNTSPAMPMVIVLPPCPWMVEDSSKIKLAGELISPIYIAPFPFPPIVVDATGPNVSMEKMGTAVVDVAIVQA